MPLLAAPFVGSVLGVLILRLPAGRPVVLARSACEDCGAALQPQDLVPLLSYAALRGRCRRCGHPIGWFHPAVELAALAVAAWAGRGTGGCGVDGRAGLGIGAPGRAADRPAGACGAGRDAAATDGAGAAGAGAAGAAGKASRNLRATGASIVDEADFTNSPLSFNQDRTFLLSRPSSFASSWTRAFPGTGLLSGPGRPRAEVLVHGLAQDRDGARRAGRAVRPDDMDGHVGWLIECCSRRCLLSSG